MSINNTMVITARRLEALTRVRDTLVRKPRGRLKTQIEWARSVSAVTFNGVKLELTEKGKKILKDNDR